MRQNSNLSKLHRSKYVLIQKLPPFLSSFATSAEDAQNFKLSLPHFEPHEFLLFILGYRRVPLTTSNDKNPSPPASLLIYIKVKK